MKHSTEYKSGGKIRTARGFYIAVAICVLALAGIATVTFRNRTPRISGENTTATTARRSPITTTATTARQVIVPATGVPDTRTTVTKFVTPPTTAVSTEGLFVFPASNVILHDYSDTMQYSETLGEWCTHNGTDFSVEKGKDVKATADGVVIAVWEDPLWGGVIELDHGNKLITRTCGVKASVGQGQSVKAGDTIGKADTVPAELLEEPHIHLELLVNGRYQDPMTLIQGEAVRHSHIQTVATAVKP